MCNTECKIFESIDSIYEDEYTLPEESYVNIKPFMVTKLDLKGVKLMTYAIIYGFTCSLEKECSASLSYFAKWSNCSVRAVIDAINSLTRLGLIKKIKHRNGYNSYVAVPNDDFVKIDVTKNADEIESEKTSYEESSREEISLDGEKTSPGCEESSYRREETSYGCEETSPNNINNNIKNKINNNIEIYSAHGNFENENEKNLEKPNAYGEYENVNLSDKELETLKSEFPSDWEERIERVSEYCAKTGKAYHNYLAVIRSWAKRDLDRENERKREHDAGRGGSLRLQERDGSAGAAPCPFHL